MIRPVPRALLIGSTLLVPSLAGAQVPSSPDAGATVALECRFQLASGGSDRFQFELPGVRSGGVRVQALWIGTAADLTIAVTGPDGTPALGRLRGESPLGVELPIPEPDGRRAGALRVSVERAEGAGTANGWLIVEVPGAPPTGVRPTFPRRPALDRRFEPPIAPEIVPQVTPQLEAVRDDVPDPATGPCPPVEAPSPDAGADTIRTVLPDGRIEVRYPDGRVTRSEIGSSCWSIVGPSGEESIVCPYSNVIRAAVADLPPELLEHADLSVWLEDLGPHLLDAIREIIADPVGFENYAAFESGRPLPEQIDLRLRLLNELLASQ